MINLNLNTTFSSPICQSMRAKYILDSELCSRKSSWECDFGGTRLQTSILSRPLLHHHKVSSPMYISSLTKYGKLEEQSESINTHMYSKLPIFLANIPSSITESPVSMAAHGMVSSSRGLSLRFPRFIKVRDDKSVELASSPSSLVDIWRSQQGKAKTLGGRDEGELLDAEIEVSDVLLSESAEENGSDT